MIGGLPSATAQCVASNAFFHIQWELHLLYSVRCCHHIIYHSDMINLIINTAHVAAISALSSFPTQAQFYLLLLLVPPHNIYVLYFLVGHFSEWMKYTMITAIMRFFPAHFACVPLKLFSKWYRNFIQYFLLAFSLASILLCFFPISSCCGLLLRWSLEWGRMNIPWSVNRLLLLHEIPMGISVSVSH